MNNYQMTTELYDILGAEDLKIKFKNRAKPPCFHTLYYSKALENLLEKIKA